MFLKKKLLSERSSFLYFVRVRQKRFIRWISWHFSGARYSKDYTTEKLPHRFHKHSSKLMRIHDENPTLLQWQINKVENLKIAAKHVHGILIHPGETFSLWKLVGRPTQKKGYLEGMELSRGKARPGIGGGLCQLSNLLNWLAWHSPLTVKERSLHSFDPFPDVGRVLPFGSGAAIFWNYVDLQLYNPTDQIFQLIIEVGTYRLKGEIRSNQPAEYTYSIVERNHFFTHIENSWYRSNEIWKVIHQKGRKGGPKVLVSEELLVKNFSKVCYQPNTDLYEVRTT